MLKYILYASTFFVLFCASSAQAYDFSVGIVGGFAEKPYRDSDVAWTVLPYASFDSEYVYVSFPSAGVHVLKSDLLKVDLQLAYMPNSFKSGDSRHEGMKALSSRYASLGAGVSAELKTPAGTFKANAIVDILDNNDGALASLSYSRPFTITPRIMAGPKVGVIWQSEKYNDYYYGISPKESARSGLNAYKANGGFSYFAGGQVIFMCSKKLKLLVEAEYLFLPNDVKNSPMVDKTGILVGYSALVYSF